MSFASLGLQLRKPGKELVMIDLKSMSVTMPEVVGHPNRRAFRGVLTLVDVASHRAPSGAKGHLVVLTRKAAEAALPSLLGMALDYAPTWDRHDVRRKVGVITSAEIVGRNVELGGYIYARDFPEIIQEIEKSGRSLNRTSMQYSSDVSRDVRSFSACAAKTRWEDGRRLGSSLRRAAAEIFTFAEAMSSGAGRKSRPAIRAEAAIGIPGPRGLGLSYEVTDVQLADADAQVWSLERVTFTGAAILRRDKAAYQDTWIELSE
jgi:hypothetical protein